VIWDEHYRVPNDTTGDFCDYPLARNQILLVVAVASEIISRENVLVMLRDLSIRILEG
jgi:hypothetical protein